MSVMEKGTPVLLDVDSRIIRIQAQKPSESVQSSGLAPWLFHHYTVLSVFMCSGVPYLLSNYKIILFLEKYTYLTKKLSIIAFSSFLLKRCIYM